MTLFFAWLMMASVQLAATMSPGPAFVVSTRNAVGYGRMVGVFTALGLAIGVGAHVVFVLMGVSFIIAQSAMLYTIIRYVGAAYLFYIGIKAILHARKPVVSEVAEMDVAPSKKTQMSLRKAVTVGFLTNLLNPKAVLFFTAVYSQFVTPETPIFVHGLYGMTSVVIEFLWFTGVALILTHAAVKQKFDRCIQWVERVCGGLMVGLGLKLALSK